MHSDRDDACVLMELFPLTSESADIYPSTLGDPKSREVDLFWKALRWLCTKERVDAWRDAIFRDADGTEIVENMICLSPSAHAMHVKGIFALEPLDTDSEGKWMTVRFWWLCFDITGDFALATVPQLPSDFDGYAYNMGLHNIKTSRSIRSGDVVTLETNNPTTHPLPDTRLLEIQWLMNRVTAISGAAKPQHPEEGDDSDLDSDSDYDLLPRPIWVSGRQF